jgi:hypothetical protein
MCARWTRWIGKAAAICTLLLATGCVTSLNSMQLQDLKGYEARGLKVEVDSETAAAWWGLAPGGPLLAAVDLLGSRQRA